jgi:hypothetical protein
MESHFDCTGKNRYGCWFNFRFKTEAGGTEADMVVGAEGGSGNPMVVDEGAIGRKEVVESIAVRCSHQEGVIFRHIAIFDLEVVFGFTSDDRSVVVDDQRLGLRTFGK